MADFLDESYGVEEARRGRLIKRVVLGVLIVAVVGTTGYFALRTHGQERVVDNFLKALRRQDYQGAYKMWGCTQDTPCKYYPPDKFAQDWGPSSSYSNAALFKVDNVDFCNTGVVFNLTYPHADDVYLWVERSTDVISFAPWGRCPGPHLQVGQFFHKIFH
jgi:hypothetical protein